MSIYAFMHTRRSSDLRCVHKWNLLNRALLCHQKLKETNNKSPTSNYPGKEVESELIDLTGESGKTQDGMEKFTGLNLY